VEIAYEKDNEVIDYTKIGVIFGTTLGIIAIVIFSLLIIKFLISSFKTSKSKLYSKIEEDLTIIYLNFDKYKNQLNKNSSSKLEKKL